MSGEREEFGEPTLVGSKAQVEAALAGEEPPVELVDGPLEAKPPDVPGAQSYTLEQRVDALERWVGNASTIFQRMTGVAVPALRMQREEHEEL